MFAKISPDGTYPYIFTALHRLWETRDERDLEIISLSQSRTSWIQTIPDRWLSNLFLKFHNRAAKPPAIHSSLPSLPNQASPCCNLVLCTWIWPTKSWYPLSQLFLSNFWKQHFVHPMLSEAFKWAKLSWASGSKSLCGVLLFHFCPSRSHFAQASHQRTHDLCHLAWMQLWGWEVWPDPKLKAENKDLLPQLQLSKS